MIVSMTGAGSGHSLTPTTIHAATEAHSPLRDAVMEKLKAMDAADQGVFHDDVTAIVAPYFPTGQPFAETQRVLAAQGLGPLRHFHGKGDSTDTTIYVSHADLVSATYSDVSLVIDFDFAGKSERDMTLRKVNAFLQAASM